jgi:hypothetical protein
MKLTQMEIIFLCGTIIYVSFFTHPPPKFIQDILRTPWGHGGSLLLILIVALQVSQLSAIFLGIAYILSSNPTLEYFEEKEKEKEKEKEQPNSGAPKSELKGLAGKILAGQGKDITTAPLPTQQPKPSSPEPKTEHFSSFSME